MPEILDIEGAFKSRGKETTEWSNKRCENGHDEDMEVVGRVWKRRDVSSELQDKVQSLKLKSEKG